MKRVLFYSLLATTALLATSCNDKNEADLPNQYSYATVMETGGDDSEIYFELDNFETFDVDKTLSFVDCSNLEAGSRVVAGVTLFPCASGAYDHTAKLYEVINVVLGLNKVVTTEDENEAIADDDLAYISVYISLTQGYLNLLTAFMSADIEDVGFYLVENQMEESDDDDYLRLELRFDRGSEEEVGPYHERYVSFDMSSYKEKLEDKKGVILRLKTIKSGTIDVEVDSNKLFGEE